MPIIELLISYMVIAVSAISSATGAPNLSWFFVVFASADLLRNVAGCLLHTQYALGHVAGSIVGIAICYSSISLISKEVAIASLQTTIILTVSLLFGIFLAALRWKATKRNSSSEYLLLIPHTVRNCSFFFGDKTLMCDLRMSR